MYVELFGSFIGGIGAVFVFYIIFAPRQRSAKGVYSQPGRVFPLKKCLIKWSINKQKKRRMKKLWTADFHGLRFKEIIPLDDPYKLGITYNQKDSLSFQGFNNDGVYIMTRIIRMPNRISEVTILVNIPGAGFFQHPIHPDSMIYNTDGETFTAGGIKFIQIEPFKTWRIIYNGLMRKGLTNAYSKEDKNSAGYVHVKFSLRWEAYTDIFNYQEDVDSDMLADSIAREPWRNRHQFSGENYTHYEQWGEFDGIFQIEDQDVTQMHLRGPRDRIFGEVEPTHRYIRQSIRLDEGSVFQLGFASRLNQLTHLFEGSFFTPNGWKHTISSTDMDIVLLGDLENPPMKYNFNFVSRNQKYDVKMDLQTQSKIYSGQSWDSVTYIMMGKVDVNGISGRCVVEYGYRSRTDCPVPEQKNYPLLGEPILNHAEHELLVVPFTKSACKSTKLVGGKGSQLAHLTSIAKDIDFIVPKGFCVTITAFKCQLKEKPEVALAVAKLEEVATKQLDGDLKKECEEVSSLILESEPCDAVQNAVTQELLTVFEGKHDERTFAIRSSAAGEDSAEMSAAGQMETILGVKGLTQVLPAISRCWSSHFTYQAVEYRRQNGQPIVSDMAVVVQEMVESEASGVLFTRDPLTGNPGVITVNANYGLGETVVSGEAEPDLVKISRAWNDELKILSKEKGSKGKLMQVTEGGGTVVVDVDEKQSEEYCLSDELFLRLSSIGLELEKYFGDPRDIEWAVFKGNIYLLQARPITSFDTESEYEMINEFNSPLSTDYEWITTANIQEMMPGAMTPLGISIFGRAINRIFEINMGEIGVKPEDTVINLWKNMTASHNHLFINLYHMNHQGSAHVGGGHRHYLEISIMGYTLKDLPDAELLHFTTKSPKLSRSIAAIKAQRMRSRGLKLTKGWESKVKECEFKGTTSMEIWEEIDAMVGDYVKCWKDTLSNSSNSALDSMVLVQILSKEKFDIQTEVLSDLALILSKCEDVYSADVPQAIKDLAKTISEIDSEKNFLYMKPEEAAQWLLDPKNEEIKLKFEGFLEKHGHRCVREAEMRETSWRKEPTKLIPSLQALIRSGDVSEPVRKSMTVSEIIASLKSPTTFGKRLALKYFIPRARKSVGKREWGKSISIKFGDNLKIGYGKLAEMMVKESRLPDTDLIFFFSHYEIGQLIKTRSAKLVAKALRRRRLFPKFQEAKFQEINIGHPKPIGKDVKDDEPMHLTKTLKGMPVSQGVIKGKARVVLNLKEAESIEHGEILIVQYTDVGWTPYFPLISGLVTEIGGLLSHGAVVAREYGLPCIVNCKKATLVIKTGDSVLLDATKGLLSRVELE